MNGFATIFIVVIFFVILIDLTKVLLSFVWLKFSSLGEIAMDEGIRSKKSLCLGMPHGTPSYYPKINKQLNLGMPRASSPVSSNDHRYFTWSYNFYSSHIMSFAWSGLYYMSHCLFCFLVCVIYPCWTHLFERAKIMLWIVRIALYASVKSL